MGRGGTNLVSGAGTSPERPHHIAMYKVTEAFNNNNNNSAFHAAHVNFRTLAPHAR